MRWPWLGGRSPPWDRPWRAAWASFAVACGLLGMGEAGNFPGSIKAVAEWFPKRERALATGIFNSGTAVGAVISYPLVGWLFLRWGWQVAFVGTGALGLVCVAVWLLLYRSAPPAPLDHAGRTSPY